MYFDRYFFGDCNFNNLLNFAVNGLDFLNDAGGRYFSSDGGWHWYIFIIVQSDSIVHCIVFGSGNNSLDWDLHEAICN